MIRYDHDRNTLHQIHGVLWWGGFGMEEVKIEGLSEEVIVANVVAPMPVVDFVMPELSHVL